VELKTPILAAFLVFCWSHIPVFISYFFDGGPSIPNSELAMLICKSVSSSTQIGELKSPPKKIKSLVTSGWYTAQ
jgi:hypothetical protein